MFCYTNNLWGVFCDILTVCWFLTSLPFSSTEMLFERTIHLLHWWIDKCWKQWLMFMSICIFTNLNTNVCDQTKSCPTSKYLLWISVLFPWHVFHVKYVSTRGVSVAINELFVHMDTHLSSRWICASAMSRIPQFTDFIPAKT